MFPFDLSIPALLSSIINGISFTPTVYRGFKTGNPSQIQVVKLIAFTLMAFGWFQYGLAINDRTTIASCLFQSFTFLVCTLCGFYLQKDLIAPMAVFLLGLFTHYYVFTFLSTDVKGVVCSAVQIGASFTNIIIINRAINNGSSVLSGPSLCLSFPACVLWIGYALQIDNLPILIPNIMEGSFQLIQIILLFTLSSNYKKTNKANIEDDANKTN